MARLDDRTALIQAMRVSTILQSHTSVPLILSLRGVTVAVGALLSLGLFGPAVPAHATPLSGDEQRRVARQFAPVLTFHPDEQFFPVRLVDDNDHRATSSIGGRIARYRIQPLSDKLRMASVYYRLHEEPGAQRRITITYWIYYVNNDFMVHGGLVPFRIRNLHPHDLEWVHLDLEPKSRGSDDSPGGQPSFCVRRLVSGAHAFEVPNNSVRMGCGEAVSLPLHFLVERGSHATAPDLNDDGRFTIEHDADRDSKFVWGIRDHGRSWRAYNESYMDPRDPERSVRLYAGGGSEDDRARACDLFAQCTPYALESVDVLNANGGLDTLAQASDDGTGRRSWFRRLFGDIDSSNVLRPLAEPGTESQQRLNRVATSDRGPFIGFTLTMSPFTSVAGARYAVHGGPVWLPDFLTDAAAMMTSQGQAILEADAFGTYPIDGMTKLLVGAAIHANVPSFDERRTDPVAGLEFRLGRWRLRTAWRDPFRQFWFDFRMYFML